jgi:hypothetical protein
MYARSLENKPVIRLYQKGVSFMIEKILKLVSLFPTMFWERGVVHLKLKSIQYPYSLYSPTFRFSTDIKRNKKCPKSGETLTMEDLIPILNSGGKKTTTKRMIADADTAIIDNSIIPEPVVIFASSVCSGLSKRQ